MRFRYEVEVDVGDDFSDLREPIARAIKTFLSRLAWVRNTNVSWSIVNPPPPPSAEQPSLPLVEALCTEKCSGRGCRSTCALPVGHTENVKPGGLAKGRFHMCSDAIDLAERGE